MELVPVVLCGGAQTATWPLSRALRPGALQAVLGSATLLELTLHRLEGLATAPPIAVCGDAVRFQVQAQLRSTGHDDAVLLVEPEGRHTAPATALAALHADDDALLLVLPSDHHVDDPVAFRRAVGDAVPLAEAGRLVVFGVRPDRAETAFGWIVPGDDAPGGRAVRRFVEKPDAVEAARLLADGALWNAGIVLARADVLRSALERFAPRVVGACRVAMAAVQVDHGFHRVGDAFRDCPATSLDVAVLERTDGAVVVPLDAGWADMGSWRSLWANTAHDERGNAVTGDALLVDTDACYVRASHRLVVALGVRDHVIVETPDAVLVAPTSRTHEVSEAVRRLRATGRSEVDVHTVVERPWGRYAVLERADGFQVKRLEVDAGQGLSLQVHARRDEQWTVVRGRARVTVDGEVSLLGPGGSVRIPAGTSHRLENPGHAPVELVEVAVGEVTEDDIVRLVDRYGRVD